MSACIAVALLLVCPLTAQEKTRPTFAPLPEGNNVVAATSYISPVSLRRKSGPARSAQEMAQGREALGRGELAKAWLHFDRVDSEDLLRDAQGLMRKINDGVQRRISEAEALELIGEKADARKAYRQILREFQGIPAADGARSRIDAIRSSK